MLNSITSAIIYPKVVIVRLDRTIQNIWKKLDSPIKSGNDNMSRLHLFYCRGNNKGLSLVEVMMALLVLLFVSLALMQTALVSIESNMKNVLRDEAVSVTEARLAEARGAAGSSTSFTSLASDSIADSLNLTAANCGQDFVSHWGNIGVYITRNLKNIQNFGFCTNQQVTPLGVEDKQVVVTVYWLWKGESYSHTNSTVLRAP